MKQMTFLLGAFCALSLQAAVVTIPVSEDTYVQGGANATNSFYGKTELLLKRSSKADVTREVFARFDLHSLTNQAGALGSATLYLYRSNDTCKMPCAIAEVTDGAAATISNLTAASLSSFPMKIGYPLPSSLFAIANLAPKVGWNAVDVTEKVREWLDAGKTEAMVHLYMLIESDNPYGILSSHKGSNPMHIEMGFWPYPPNMKARINAGSSEVSISWSPFPKAVSYQVETASDANGPWMLTNTVSSLTAVVPVTNPRSPHWYRVRAVGAEGASLSDYSPAREALTRLVQTASEDTYLHKGEADKEHGSSVDLVVKNYLPEGSPAGNHHRESLIRVPTILGQAAQATSLRVFMTSHTGKTDVEERGLYDYAQIVVCTTGVAWAESATFNDLAATLPVPVANPNRDTKDEVATFFTPDADGTWVDVPLAKTVVEAAAGDPLSFRLYSAHYPPSGSGALFKFSSREGTNPAQLVFEGYPFGYAPLTLTALSDGVCLSWSAQLEAVSYRVYRSFSTNELGALLATVTDSTFTDLQPKIDTEVFYSIVPVNAEGVAGARSDVKSVTFLPFVDLPIEADTFVNRGRMSETAGSADVLVLKRYSNWHRHALLQFSLANLPRTGIKKAECAVTAAAPLESTPDVSAPIRILFECIQPPFAWDEASMNWTTLTNHLAVPYAADAVVENVFAELDGCAANEGERFAMDVTDALKKKMVDGDSTLLLHAFSQTEGNNRSFSFYSREAADTAKRPTLRVWFNPNNKATVLLLR